MQELFCCSAGKHNWDLIWPASFCWFFFSPSLCMTRPLWMVVMCQGEKKEKIRKTTNKTKHGNNPLYREQQRPCHLFKTPLLSRSVMKMLARNLYFSICLHFVMLMIFFSLLFKKTLKNAFPHPTSPHPNPPPPQQQANHPSITELSSIVLAEAKLSFSCDCVYLLSVERQPYKTHQRSPPPGKRQRHCWLAHFFLRRELYIFVELNWYN